MNPEIVVSVRSVFEALNNTSSTSDVHLDGLMDAMIDDLVEGGINRSSIKKKPTRPNPNDRQPDTTVPGWFRPTKNWDIAIYHGDELMGLIELKTLTKSVAKNVNNRIEESIGSPFDLSNAVLEGLLGHLVRRPVMGYVMVIPCNQETEKIKHYNESDNRASRFLVDEEYEGASIASIFAVSSRRLLQKGIYDAVWIVMQSDGGEVTEPDDQLTYSRFIKTFIAENMIRNA